MNTIFHIFAIKREERLAALLLMVLLLSVNAMVLIHYYNLFTPLHDNYWRLFIRNFHISGFDPITLSVVSDWSAGYNVYRHPLLAFFMYPPYLLNRLLMTVTGINCAIFIVAAMQILSAFYAAIFLFRIFREIIGIDLLSSYILLALYQSFAYVTLSAMVPDHFIFSSLMLILALYITGRRLRSGRPMKIWQTVVYFIFTAGTSLNNGLKIFLSALSANGRRFFSLRFLFLAVLLPSIAIWGFCRWEYRVFVYPEWHAKKVAAEKRKAERKKAAEFSSVGPLRVAAAKNVEPDTQKIVTAEKTKPATAKKKRRVQGRPIGNGAFSRWTDISTPRWESLVENVFGEGIQLHKRHLLQDVLTKRPVMVSYDMTWNYVVEAIIVLLFILGILCGIGSAFLRTCLSYFLLDMVLHVGLGFGLNEAYIMSVHWIYAVPIAIAYLLRLIHPRYVWAAHLLLLLVAAFLFGWNISLIYSYLA